METHAYSELYLSHAMENLGVMMDAGINMYGVPAASFYRRFLNSGVAEQFGTGNPYYTVGHSGLELADMVIEQSGGGITPISESYSSLGRRPEYWAGWVLAYYQWKTGRTFAELPEKGLDIVTVIALYHPLHEADPEKFHDVAEGIIANFTINSNPLKEAREHSGMTQKELSNASGVSLRMIRAYEQKQQDLSHAEFGSVLKLSKVLRTPIEKFVDIAQVK